MLGGEEQDGDGLCFGTFFLLLCSWRGKTGA